MGLKIGLDKNLDGFVAGVDFDADLAVLTVRVRGDHQFDDAGFVLVTDDAVAFAVGEEVRFVLARPCEHR